MLSSHLRPLSTKEGQRSANLSSHFQTFKLMSYNILAQTHMMTHIRNYKGCPRECLNWSFRRGILKHELEVEKPDIFCLQEVEESHKIELFEPLRKMGYDALFVPRGEGKPDGCALLYNTSKFQIADFAPVLYFRPEVPLLDRPNVGMVTRLELCDYPGNYITVANTHILYNQRRLDIKISQLQILLAETERLAFAENPDKYHPVILTGDLNVNADTCLISLLRHRYVNCRNYNMRHWRSVSTPEGKDLSIPDQLLQHYLKISPDCQYIDVVEGRKKGIRDVRKTEDLQDTLNDHRVFPESDLGKGIKKRNSFKSHETEDILKNERHTQFNKSPEGRRAGVLQHGFPFVDVYEHPELYGVRQSSTPRTEPKQNVFDYMFYSGDLKFKHKAPASKPVKGQLQLLSRLRMPSAPEHKLYFPSLPNYACGSDHLPLCAKFLLPVQ